jgi:hypothetical protein
MKFQVEGKPGWMQGAGRLCLRYNRLQQSAGSVNLVAMLAGFLL